jgi:chemotaxis protein histidine kinase CheA
VTRCSGIDSPLPTTREFERPAETLEDAVAALTAGDLDDGTREDARGAAHKLRGSLGMYGLHRGGEIAGEVEDILMAEPVDESRTRRSRAWCSRAERRRLAKLAGGPNGRPT